MPYAFYLPTKLLMGAGCLNELGGCTLPGQKALLVTLDGCALRKNGVVARVEAQLARAGVGMAPDAVNAGLPAAAAYCREQGCDFVVGLGGERSIEAAKAVAVMAKNPGADWGGVAKNGTLPCAPLPIVAIATAAGTCAPTSPWVAFAKEQIGESVGFCCEKAFPVLSVADPELMAFTPARHTAYQGFDALFHSIEGYLSRTENPIRDLLALEAVRLIRENLPRAVHDGSDWKARAGVSLAGALSGMVEGLSGCISAHSITRAMEARCPKLPHGAALTAISGAYYRRLIRLGVNRGRMAALAQALGGPGEDPSDFLAALDALQKRCCVDGLALSSFGVSPEEFPLIVQNAGAAMGLLRAAPVTMGGSDILEILSEAFC